MSTLDTQLGVVDESAYGTAPAVSRFFEFNSEGVDDDFGRLESNGLRAGTRVQRSDRWTPIAMGAAGDIELDVMSKGFGFWLKHMVGSVSSSAPADSVTTHTGTIAELFGKSFAAQFNKPLHPAGTAQPVLYKGGKITKWQLGSNVGQNLTATLTSDFQDIDLVTALAVASYPTSMDNLTWAGLVVTVGGVQVDVTEFSVSCDNQLKLDRRYQRGNVLKKEPVEADRRQIEWSMKADFDSTTQRARVASATRAGALAAIVATWTGPILAGATTYPSLQVSIPAARFDSWESNIDGADPLEQELSGRGLYDGTNSAVSLIYKSVDTTP